MPIGKLIITMSVPMMISMFIQALYNVVDSIFVAKLCEDALTAVSLTFPMQNIMYAVSVGTGVGLNALVSRSLGEGNLRRAEKAANVQISLGLIYTFILILIGLFFSRTYFSVQTDVDSIIEYGRQYFSIVCIWSLGLFYGQSFEKLLISTGNATQAMIAQALGAILNIALDPLFIFTFDLGVRGAAIATVIGQFGAALCAFLLNLKYNTATHFDLRQILPDFKILRFIYAVGLPSMLTIGLDAISGYLMNNIFLSFSTTAAAVFGIWLKLQGFGFMPVFGLNNGTLAIFAYNRGANKFDRVFKTLRLGLILGICITIVIVVLYELFPSGLLSLFSASEYMMSIGVIAIRLCAVSMVFGAACVIISSACQSLGYARYALLISVCRQALFMIPIAYLFSLLGHLALVWLSLVVASVLSLLVTAFICRYVVRKLKSEASCE